MSEVLFSDKTTCERCGSVDFFQGLRRCDENWLCIKCVEEPEVVGD